MNDEIKIEDYIPFGHENKVTRKYLVAVTGMTDREVRLGIANARINRRVMIVPNKGYFRPRTHDTTDAHLMQVFIAQEVQRKKTLEEAIENYRSMERDYFNESKQIPGQMRMEFVNG